MKSITEERIYPDPEALRNIECRDTSSTGFGEEDDVVFPYSPHEKNVRSSVALAQEELEVAKIENKWVWRLRLLTAVMMTCVAVSVCLMVYFLSRKAEMEDFEEDFQHMGVKLITSFEAVLGQRLGILESFASELTAYANDTWPFVTSPDFAFRAQSAASLARVLTLTLAPKVQMEDLDDWNSYAVANQGWKAEGIAMAQGVRPSEVVASPIAPELLDVHSGGTPRPEDGPGPYFPTWTGYPVQNNSNININWYADPEHIIPIDRAFETGMPTFEMSYEYITKEKDNRYNIFQQNPTLEYQDDAFSVVFVPVFNKVDKDAEGREVVGVLQAIVYWRDHFIGLLPPGPEGILVVLENSCGQKCTFRIDGRNVAFVGFDDFHDSKYDYLATGVTIDSIVDPDNLREGNKGFFGQAEFPDCHYTARVYPSQHFEDTHYTKKPMLHSIALGCLFLVTCGVFLLYDYMVEKRQTVVMKSARQSGKLVQSLFPQNIRDRLYEEQEAQEQEQQQQTRKSSVHSAWELHSPRRGKRASLSSARGSITSATDVGDHSNSSSGFSTTTSGKTAIASLYPKTTIFFADLAGFTKWSSTRSPTEVFQLLEALYGAFDEIATRRNVFKVETIGDCYVAVTGVPEPQEDHAEIMVKFARDCMIKMNLVTDSLSDILGADTANLTMRVGLHSGPVTAGVLRGQKARFQLFGDTVNTASRMESNGLKGRIHASQMTADELIQAGKEDWVEFRERTVFVKGKGEMQTYFINPPMAGSKSVASSSKTADSSKTTETITV